LPIVYNFIVSLTWQFLKLLSFINPKLNQFVKGRKNTIYTLKTNISETDSVIWVHAASLGEYEQGLPIMEKIRLEFPQHKLLLTFFSPSGYEIKKSTKAADVVCYLPLDTKKKVSAFLDLAHPELVLFIKYEIWPNYLGELKKRAIPTLLVSALFKSNQIYFKGYGGFMRKALLAFTHFYVQDNTSKKLLESINLNNVTVSGDTRFDRVHEILERDNQLDFIKQFKQSSFCMVAGSTWPEDEKIIVPYLNTSSMDEKFIIAPHTLKSAHVQDLKNSITKKSILFSNLENQNIEDADVLILDTIGILTKVYSYADVAYVGGGFATGLHNTLEPAVFGIPVLIGPNYKGFIEAENLVTLGGIIPVKNEISFSETAKELFNNEDLRRRLGKINEEYIRINKGASIQIMEHIRTLL
jgi:3-deoxy-D-manno-octulosonic-acid transferase